MLLIYTWRLLLSPNSNPFTIKGMMLFHFSAASTFRHLRSSRHFLCFVIFNAIVTYPHFSLIYITLQNINISQKYKLKKKIKNLSNFLNRSKKKNMGIKDLLRFMKPYIKPIHIKKYAGNRVNIKSLLFF